MGLVKKLLILSMFICVLFLASCEPVPQCGNGVIDLGENYNNCCLDTGCKSGFTCNNNLCEAQKDYLTGDDSPIKDNITLQEVPLSDEATIDIENINDGKEIALPHQEAEITDTSNELEEEELLKNIVDPVAIEEEPVEIEDSFEDLNPESHDPSSVSTKTSCTQDWQCDDGFPITKDTCGSKGKCIFEEITWCEHDDGYCKPNGCTFVTDNDCKDQMVYCNNDYDCFAQAAEFCQLSKMLHKYSLNYPPFQLSPVIEYAYSLQLTESLEVSSKGSGKCELKLSHVSTDFLWNEAYRQDFIDVLTPYNTSEEIDSYFDDSRITTVEGVQDLLEERATNCQVDSSDLTQFVSEVADMDRSDQLAWYEERGCNDSDYTDFSWFTDGVFSLSITPP